MTKHYLFFSRNLSFQPDSAHEIHDVLCANAAANLGYSSVLVYLHKSNNVLHNVAWLSPLNPRQPEKDFIEFYASQAKLKVAPLPLAPPIDRIGGKWTSSSTLLCKYYSPIHIFPHTKIVHTRDWNFAKTAVQHGVPTIYERHYYQETPFEPEIVQSRFFQIAITQSELIRESLIRSGMPPEKVVWLHNGFEQSFLVRQAQQAQAWRQELLTHGRKHLVVYSGALYRFKGIDCLLDAAQELPQVQFVLTGGTQSQVQDYQQLARDKNLDNVKFLGWILPRNRLVSLLQAADVLAHPHCSGEAANFTNPVKFFQYMASGTPIVATEIPPLMEFKGSKAIALWCEPDNPMQLAHCIQQALATYPRKVEGYTESLDFVRQFSWENRISKILSYVEEAMRPSLVG
jgi:glycosyltransferase involved in cell wall biosynthesis